MPGRDSVPERNLRVARADDAESLAMISAAAKASYRAWARPPWPSPTLSLELDRWRRRLRDQIGWTALLLENRHPIGAIHLTAARERRGLGDRISGRAHLGALFVVPRSWGHGHGSALLARSMTEAAARGDKQAQLCTAIDNQRSRSFYENRGWCHDARADTQFHDNLWQITYRRPVGDDGRGPD